MGIDSLIHYLMSTATFPIVQHSPTLHIPTQYIIYIITVLLSSENFKIYIHLILCCLSQVPWRIETERLFVIVNETYRDQQHCFFTNISLLSTLNDNFKILPLSEIRFRKFVDISAILLQFVLSDKRIFMTSRSASHQSFHNQFFIYCIQLCLLSYQFSHLVR